MCVLYSILYLLYACLSALRPYSSDDLHDYEKHFTVMNYRTDSKLKQVGSVDINVVLDA